MKMVPFQTFGENKTNNRDPGFIPLILNTNLSMTYKANKGLSQPAKLCPDIRVNLAEIPLYGPTYIVYVAMY